MLFRYRARNWPESLTSEEQEQWQQYRQQRLTDESNNKILTLPRFFKALSECRTDDITSEQQQVLDDLEAYGNHLQSEFN